MMRERCAHCGGAFTVRTAHMRRLCCSPACSREYRSGPRNGKYINGVRAKRACVVCGRVFRPGGVSTNLQRVYPGIGTRCSRACYGVSRSRAWQEAQTV